MNHKDKLILAKQKKLKERVKKIMEYNDEEKNNLSYNIAIKYDKRNYCQYYISLLRTKHNFIFSFIYNNDYNSKIIKINLYLISFSIYYTVNALFFDDETMHKIYLDKGSLNIEYQLPKIIYSSIISIILNTLLKLLALSSDKIIEFKKDKTKDNIHVREIKLKKTLKIKFILYFILGFIILFVFLYYISMFGVIYKNTQIHLLKETLISFGLSSIYPFGIYLLPGIFRIPALSNKNNKKECLYKFSKFMQYF